MLSQRRLLHFEIVNPAKIPWQSGGPAGEGINLAGGQLRSPGRAGKFTPLLELSHSYIGIHSSLRSVPSPEK